MEFTTACSTPPNGERSLTWRLFYVALAVVVFAILLVALVSIAFYIQRPNCRLQDSLSYTDLSRVSPTSSKDNKILARFSGHLELERAEGKNKYLALDLISVKWEHSDIIHVTLSSNCANLKLHVKTDRQRQMSTIDRIQVEYKLPDHPTARTCDALSVDIQYPFGTHYSCWQPRTYACSGGKLSIDALELELFGDPSIFRKRKFDSPRSPCEPDSRQGA